MPHTWLRHVTHVTESRHTCDWVMSHLSIATFTNCESKKPNLRELCHIWNWVMSHMWLSHVTYVTESCHTCDVSPSPIVNTTHQSCERYATFVTESCHTCDWVTSHMCLSHVTHVMFHHHQLSTLHTKFARDMPHLWLRHVTHVTESCHTCDWVTSFMCLNHTHTHTHTCDVTCVPESCHTCDVSPSPIVHTKFAGTNEWVGSYETRLKLMNETLI